MRKSLRLVISLPFLTLALARCGSSGSDSDPGPSAGSPATGGAKSSGGSSSGGRSGSGGTASGATGGSEKPGSGGSEDHLRGGESTGGMPDEPEATGGKGSEPSTTGGTQNQPDPSAGAGNQPEGTGGRPSEPGSTGGTGEPSAAGSGGAGGADVETGGTHQAGDGNTGGSGTGGSGTGGSGTGGSGTGGSGTGGASACVPSPDCDDGDSCTADHCDAASGCVHTNPDFSCSAWSGGLCAGEALVALVAGERTACVPAQTRDGVLLCTSQTCGGAPGCSVTYRSENVVATTTDTGLRLTGDVTQVSGQVNASTGLGACVFQLSLASPTPFVANFTTTRLACSESVDLQHDVETDWSGLRIASTNPLCNLVASQFRAQLDAELDNAVGASLEKLDCSLCANNCPDDLVCHSAP